MMNPVSAIPFIYFLEKPLRDDRSGGPPLIVPAWRINNCFPLRSLAASSLSRTRRPTGMPVTREVSRSHSSISSGRRIVSVLLIWQKCNTPVFVSSPMHRGDKVYYCFPECAAFSMSLIDRIKSWDRLGRKKEAPLISVVLLLREHIHLADELLHS